MYTITTSDQAVDGSTLDGRLATLFRSDPGAMADADSIWAELRAAGPVRAHGGAWMFSSYEGVKQLISDPRAGKGTFNVGRRAEAIRASLPPEGQVAFDEISNFEGMYMGRNEGETHARLRRIVQRTFTPRRLALMDQVIQTQADRYLTRLATTSVVDFTEFAYGFPLKIMGDLLALPEEDLEQVHAWTSKMARNRGGSDLGPLLEARDALREFRPYLENLVAKLRLRPQSDEEVDLVGDLLNANQGERLSEPELIAEFADFLFAGHQTMTILLGSGLLELLRTGQWAVIRESPELIPQAVEELMRYVTPVQWLLRNILEPMTVEGQALETGEVAMLMIAAAHRDPAAFPDPNRLDFGRPNSKAHFGFGRGPHVCLGIHLARTEAIRAFEVLVRRFPDLKLATDDFAWTGNAGLRSLVSLPIDLGREA